MIIEIDVGIELVSAFAQAVGDHSSIHVDPQFARKTRFREPIVHGMLPVVLLLGCLNEGNPLAPPAKLLEISCRFHSGLRIAERVRIEADRQSLDGERESWLLGVRRVSDGLLITSAKAVLLRSPRTDGVARDGTSLLMETVEELAYSAADLRPGMTERLGLRISNHALRPLQLQFALQTGERERLVDSTTLALAPLSTLIGMRLPGRYATFTEFDATFPNTIDAGKPVTLEGTVASILPSASRMRLDVRWTQGSQTVGSGTASTLIGSPAPVGVLCADVKAGQLGLGLEGRVALVTGASRGIGEAVAKSLAMSGARVVVHYFRGQQDAAAIVRDIVENGGSAIAAQADLADQDAVERMFAEIESGFGPVEILVNNAVGDFSPKPIEELRTSDYLAELNVSLFGMHACCRLALPHMRRRRWGKIINMGTVATELPVVSQNKYITAKSAVVGYTRSLAAEVAADNIQVNLVAPAMTETSLIAALPAALVKRLAEDNPGGVLLVPMDVAKVVLFLVSDLASSISGQQFVLTRGAPPFL